MLPLLAVVALGFSLEGRGLANKPEPCKSSCDSGHDASCDEQDVEGTWTMGCDMHPTTSCDADCHYSPPPPTAPWLGDHGTYPTPPPPPPPVNRDVLMYGGGAFLIALVLLCCVCTCTFYGTGSGLRSERVAYWCCCALSSRRNRDSWYYDEDEDDEPQPPSKAAPPQESTLPSLNI